MGTLKQSFSKKDYDALCCAVWENQPERVRKLLKRGLDPEFTPEGEEPLFVNALQRNYHDVVAAFLDAGVDPNKFRDKSGRYMLQIATTNRSNQTAAMLLDHKANPNILIDDAGFSLMHHVVSSNNGELTLKMLEAGADIDVLGPSGQTVISYAAPKAKAAIHEYHAMQANRRLHGMHQRLRRNKPNALF